MAGRADPTPVWLYLPNLIGYSRLVLAIASLSLFTKTPFVAAICYTVSQVLDGVDGHVARAYGQASKYGAMLDLLTDRISTVGIYLLLAATFPRCVLLIFVLAAFDLAGHWVYLHAQMMRGMPSHKMVPDSWPLLKLYYENKYAMVACHAAYETVFAGLLYTGISPAASVLLLPLVVVAFPLAICKCATNALQIFLGFKFLVEIDEEERRR